MLFQRSARQAASQLRSAQLHKVPSAISYTVNKIENELGVKIFERKRKKVTLTPAGKRLVEEGQDIVSANQKLINSIRQTAGGWESELKIAIDSILPMDNFYPLINKFYVQVNHVTVKVSKEVLAGGWDALVSGRADLIFGAEGNKPAGDYDTRLLGELEMVYVAASEHPASNFDEPVNNHQLKEYIEIVTADTAKVLAARVAGLQIQKRRFTVPGVREKMNAIKAGIGVGILPRYMAEAHINNGRLKEILLTTQYPNVRLVLAWNAKNTGKALHWFIDQIDSNLNWNNGDFSII